MKPQRDLTDEGRPAIKPQEKRKKRTQKAPEIKGGIPGDLLNEAGHEGPTQ